MLTHSIGTIEGEVRPSGAMISTPMELTVVALARREKGRGPGTRSRLVQALFAIDRRISVRRREWTPRSAPPVCPLSLPALQRHVSGCADLAAGGLQQRAGHMALLGMCPSAPICRAIFKSALRRSGNHPGGASPELSAMQTSRGGAITRKT